MKSTLNLKDIKDITLGTLTFMTKKKCAIMSGGADIEAFIEFLYIHTHDLKELRKMTEEEYREKIDDFIDQIPLSSLKEITEAVNEKMQKLIDSQFTQADNKKKSV